MDQSIAELDAPETKRDLADNWEKWREIKLFFNKKYANRIANPILAAQVLNSILAAARKQGLQDIEQIENAFRQDLEGIFPEQKLYGSATSAGQVESSPLGYGVDAKQGFNMGDLDETTLAALTKGKSEIEALQIKRTVDSEQGLDLDNPLAFEAMLLLNKKAGLNSFRFSIAWKKVPRPDGTVNQEELKRYSDQVKKCIELGIEPFVVLHHFDLPDDFDWTDEDARRKFYNFAEVILKELIPAGAKYWVPVNEPNVELAMRYLMALWPPHIQTGVAAFFKARHNMSEACKDFYMLAKRIAAENEKKITVATAINMAYFDTGPDLVGSRYGIARAAEWWDHDLQLAMFSDTEQGVDYFDTIGIQYYWTRDIAPIKAIKQSIYNRVQQAKASLGDLLKKEDADQLAPKAKNTLEPPERRVGTHGQILNPSAVYDVIMSMHRKHPNVPIMITEWGADLSGSKHEDKVWYITQTLKAIQQAENAGVKIVGAWMWTLIRNWEIVGPDGGGWGGETGYNFGMAGEPQLDKGHAPMPAPIILYPDILGQIVKQGVDAGFIGRSQPLTYRQYIDAIIDLYTGAGNTEGMLEVLISQLDNINGYIQSSHMPNKVELRQLIDEKKSQLLATKAA